MKERCLPYSIALKDTTHGYGVVSKKSFDIGEKIGDIRGLIKRQVYQRSLQILPGQHIVDLHFAGYLLHSCSPNTNVDMNKLTVNASKAIKAGDFLYIDYSKTEDRLWKQFHCHCGSANCRGWIVGRKELPYPKLIKIIDRDNGINAY